jgi:hypothetical protein
MCQSWHGHEAQGADGGGGGVTAPTSTPTATYAIVAADALAASAGRFKAYRESKGQNVTLGLVSRIVGDAKDAASAPTKIHDWVRTQFDARPANTPF